MIIYNDFKERDILENIKDIQDREIILNNFIPSKALIRRLEIFNVKTWVAIKYYKDLNNGTIPQLVENGVKNLAFDAENYGEDGWKKEYKKSEGQVLRQLFKSKFERFLVYPENLGGKKYKGYDEFLNGLRPERVLMERTYQQTEWYNILYYYLRTKIKTMSFRPEVWIGVWPEEVIKEHGKEIAEEHLKYADKISRGKVFWYSETKSLPNA